MEITLTGDNISLTEAISDYAKKKLERLNTLGQVITNLHVVFSSEHQQHLARGTLSVPGKHLFAHAEADDLYKAIDLLEDKFRRQLRDIHSEQRKH